MLKIRITFFNEWTPEHSVEVETEIPELSFNRIVETTDWYYDYAEDIYYKLDNSIGLKII